MAAPMAFRPTPQQADWLRQRTADGCTSKNHILRLALQAWIDAHPTTTTTSA